MTSEHDQNIQWLAEWLSDPSNARATTAFPLHDGMASTGGVYAWHGDEIARDAVRKALGPIPDGPLFVAWTRTPLNTRIIRTHLRNTKASLFRRSLAAILWDELGLHCLSPNMLDFDGDRRLTDWMLQHLSVTTVPIGDPSALTLIYDDVLARLDPPLNTTGVQRSPARSRLRKLRSRYLGGMGVVRELEMQMVAIRNAERTDPGIVVPISRARGRGSRRSRAACDRGRRPFGEQGSA